MATTQPPAQVKLMGRPIRPFRGLQWKLTLSYALVTVGALMALELFVLFLIGAWLTTQAREVLPRTVAQLSDQVGPYLRRVPPDVTGLETFLAALDTLEFDDGTRTVIDLALANSVGVIAVANARSEVVASSNPATIPVGSPLLNEVEGKDKALLESVLAGQQSAANVVLVPSRRPIIAAAPVLNERGQVLGITFIQVDATIRTLLGGEELLPLIATSLLFVSVFAVPVGALFGFLNARWLARRLGRLALVAETWSRGDFSGSADDRSSDELGQLARRLNNMAEELQTLFQTRQELAMSEERNRLARDLHDSVKQQVFATAMQVGAAKALLPYQPEKAAGHLAEAEVLTHQIQGELTGLIHALRPAALGTRGLGAALEEYLQVWSRQNNIKVQAYLGAAALAHRLEQALYRVAQEALANIAKHSRAAQVAVSLRVDAEHVVMVIADSGKGFEPDEAKGRGMGLSSMHERLTSFGGRLVIDSKPGEGTTLTAEIPVATLP